MNTKLQYKKNFIKKSLFSLALVFLIVPAVSCGQHYIIEDIPNTGDDGLRPKIDTSTTSDDPKIIEDVTTDVITTVTETTETTVTEVVVENKTTFQLFGLVGTTTGAALVLATTAVPFFVTTPTMIQDLMLLNFFGLFAGRKNKKRWGVVFDVYTKRPIPAAKITLFDGKMKELETTYSDKEGRFGFLAGEGTYNIDVYKKNYKLYSKNKSDEIYGNLYTGGAVRFSGDKVLVVNLAMKSQTIDWNAYADKKIAQYTSTWSLIKKYLFTTLYIIGFTATIVITIFYPSMFNIILVSINSVFFIIFYFFKKKDYGTVVTSDKKPVPFAVVNLYDETGKKGAFAVTDVIGRYYMLADNGQYTMRTTGQSVGQNQQNVHSDVHVRDGFVDKDIMFE